MSAQIQLKNTKLSRIGEACTFYFQFVKCQDFDSTACHAYSEMRIIFGQVGWETLVLWYLDGVDSEKGVVCKGGGKVDKRGACKGRLW